MYSSNTLPVILILALGAACESGQAPERDCSGEVELVVTQGDGGVVTEAGWALAGFATHEGGLVIRTIRLGGVPATTSGVGTVNWTVTIPPDMVDGIRATDDPSIDAEVTDSCGTIHLVEAVAAPGEDAEAEPETKP